MNILFSGLPGLSFFITFVECQLYFKCAYRNHCERNLATSNHKTGLLILNFHTLFLSSPILSI